MQTFQTALRLVRQPNGLYMLTATTTAPDSCHMAARPMRGAAGGQPVPSDHMAILLPVVAREPNTGTPSTIRHVVPNLRLGKDGKLGVTAFLVANPDRGLLCTTSVRLSPTRSGRLVAVPSTPVPPPQPATAPAALLPAPPAPQGTAPVRPMPPAPPAPQGPVAPLIVPALPARRR